MTGGAPSVIRCGRIALVLGLGFLATLSLTDAARADEVTLNVPVQLTNIAANVTRGRVQCLVHVEYQGGRGQATGQASGRRYNNIYKGESAEFGFDANGAYSATATVRVQVEPPRELVEAMVPITIGPRNPQYVCDIQVAMPGGEFHPQRPREAGSGMATGRLDGPPWSLPRPGSNPSVNGQLNVTQPTAPAASR